MVRTQRKDADESRMRLNPETGKPWVKGEKRSDGYIFERYRYNKIDREGYYWTLFAKPEVFAKAITTTSKGNPRINPDTGKRFVRGDKRPAGDIQDGLVFFKYESGIAKNGYQRENWKEAGIGQKIYAEWRDTWNTKVKKLLSYRKDENGKKFVYGKKYGNKYFLGYKTANNYYSNANITKPTFYFEEWGENEDDVFLKRILKKASLSKVKCSAEYLLSIFPKDKKCPITRKRFTTLQYHPDTPALDKLEPEKGYVEGNVAWISHRMNTLKSDMTTSQIMKLWGYVSSHTAIEKHREEHIKDFIKSMDESVEREKEINESLKKKGIKPIRW